jgi:hypothetical protein
VDTKKTFVTAAQLSAICGLSEAWLRSEAQTGRIPHLKVGARTMFNPAAVEKALLARAVGELACAADEKGVGDARQ